MRYFQIQLQRVLSGKAINAAVSTLIVVMPILFAITNTNFWNNYSGIEPETKQNITTFLTWAMAIVAVLYFLYNIFLARGTLHDVKSKSVKSIIYAERGIGRFIINSTVINYDEINKYLRRLHTLFADFIHPDVSYVDLMDLFHGENRMVKYLGGQSTKGKASSWLEIIASDVQRSTELRLIPVDINKNPWPGSGMAFSTGGIIYVDRFLDRLKFHEFEMNCPSSEIQMIYSEWEKDHAFSSIVSVSIPMSHNVHSSVGVINFNFGKKYPFGKRKALTTSDRIKIECLFSTHLIVLSNILNRIRELK